MVVKMFDMHEPMDRQEKDLWITVYINYLRRCMPELTAMQLADKELPNEQKYIDWAEREATAAVQRLRRAEKELCGCNDCKSELL